MVKTRRAFAKEKLEHSARDGPSGQVHEAKSDTYASRLDIIDQKPKDGSLKFEIGGCHKSVSSNKKSTVTSRKSFEARKKQLEFEATQALAKIEKEVIQKKLEADVAALEEECSQGSHGDRDRNSLSDVSQKVEQWLNRSHQAAKGPPSDTSASPPPRDPRLADEIHGAINLPPPVSAQTQCDFQQLAQALKDIATAATTNAPNANMLSRLCTPKDLPIFSGDPMEWLAFKQAYQESTEVCHFTEKENMWRLRKCLRGQARDSVTALLVSAASPETVMSTLQLQFGNPDVILPRILQDIKKLQPMNLEYQKDIISFSVKVRNYVAAVRVLEQEEFLRGVTIASVILSKLPPVLISKWTDYGYARIEKGTQSRLEILSDFLSEEALKVSKTAVSLSVVRNEPKRKYSEQYQSVLLQNVSANSEEKCRFCRVGYHTLPSCKKFKKALRKDRWSYVKRSGLCYRCIASRHSRESCSAPVCDIDNCGKSHHKLLHYKTSDESIQSNVHITQLSDSEPTVETVSTINSMSQVLLKVVTINIEGPNGIISVCALLDDGSTVSLISAGLAERVGIRGYKKIMRVSGAWQNTELVCDSEVVDVGIYNRDGTKFTFKARSVSELNLPTQVSVNPANYPYLAQIQNEISLPCSFKPEILLGQDNYHLITPIRVIRGKPNEPFATLTPLGWCIHGRISNLPCDNLPHSSLLIHDDHDRCLQDLHDEVRRSFSLESLGITTKPRQNSEDVQAVKYLEQNSTLIDGRWYVGLPWKNVTSSMPESFPNAKRRLFNVEKKMKASEGYALRYTERVHHLLNNDFAKELVTPQTSPRTWYLPHFGVDNPNKNKLRLVFDAAAKSNGYCLNDFLYKGPDLLMSLYGMMLRFRENKIAVTADIKDMFLRIKIIPADQDALRFLWRDKYNDPVKTFKMTSLIFGANCSPFIAQFVKNKNAHRFESSKPAAVRAICKQHYVDDYIDSIENSDDAIQLVKDIIYIHNEGGFVVCNWQSNSTKVLNSLPNELLANNASKLKIGQQLDGERTLGLLWFPLEDTLGFDVSFKRIPSEILAGKRPTKREALQVIMSIFDVYGFLSPFTITGKIILQQTWKEKINWDETINDDIYKMWQKWLDNLKLIGGIRLPRCYHNVCVRASDAPCLQQDIGASTQSYSDLELHLFCDGSTQAMCVVAFWRWTVQNKIYVAFVSSKCRVAPVKPTTVPRLELQAALMAARLADTIQTEHRIKATRKVFWCDSTTVLQWIRNDKRNYKTFVAYRLGEIDELTNVNEWKYVPTGLNVADIGTRECYDLTVFEKEWFAGPKFLYQHETSWPADVIPETCNKPSYDIECVSTIHNEVSKDLPVPNPSRFSSWLRLVRSTSAMLKFIYQCRHKLTGDIDGVMMARAETLLVKYAQAQSFPEDIRNLKNKNTLDRKSRLLTLTPILDEHGVLRAGGRIGAARDVPGDTKRPVILDGRHHVARLIAKHYHIRAAHGNTETVVNELKQKYWLIRIRPTVKRVAMECMVCKIRRAQPRPPRMGDLPEARLAHHQRVFTFCGLDLFGPMEVAVGRRKEKRYAVLFTCLTVRAIHIELVSTLTTDSLIMALRRMAARRGWPLHLYSDNGTNLRGAAAEIKLSIQNLNQEVLKSEAINHGTTWTFIPPSSPHWGGAWERLIRTVKSSLKVVLKERVPREEVLLTLMAEVEQIVNSRPLTHVSVEPGTDEALTPNHFLLGSSSNLPVLGEFNDSDLFMRKQWRIAQRLADMYWRRWVREVLPDLIPRTKWTQEERPLQVGDLVIVVDPNAPRNMWMRGRIEAILPGKDERVRVVDMRTRTGLMRRPATRVAPIPIG